MKVYSPNTNRGRHEGEHDVHHRYADQPKRGANKAAKVLRHVARQDGKRQVAEGIKEQ